MKYLIYAFLFTLISSCGTFRPMGDKKTEELTGIRTMLGQSWCMTGNVCLERAIAKAKEECIHEKKEYAYVSHEIGLSTKLQYKCQPLPVSL